MACIDTVPATLFDRRNFAVGGNVEGSQSLRNQLQMGYAEIYRGKSR